jgi:hypothetical protein
MVETPLTAWNLVAWSGSQGYAAVPLTILDGRCYSPAVFAGFMEIFLKVGGPCRGSGDSQRRFQYKKEGGKSDGVCD